MSSGVASPPSSSHPPLPKKPNLAPKPKRLSLSSPGKTSQNADDSIADISCSSLDTTLEDTEAESSPQMTNSSDLPLRPTPKPRKTINLKSNGSPGEGYVAPSPKPRVPQKPVPSVQEPDSSPSAADPSPGLPNGNGCEAKGVNGVRPSPRERPSIPSRRLTVDESDLVPKVSPKASPSTSPKRSPLIRSKSLAPDTILGSDAVADASLSSKGEGDKLRSASPQRHSPPVTSDSPSSPSDVPPTTTNGLQGNGELANVSTNGGSVANRPKPSISPKKPNLAMIGKRKTVASSYNIADKDNDVKLSEILKKPPPQRPSLPPKRPPGYPSPGSKPKDANETASKPKLNNQVPSSQTDPINCNKSEELSNNVPLRGKPPNENLQTSKGTAATPDSSPKLSRTEHPKMPALHPRKTSKWNPVAPPRRVKSMSESDPNSELSAEKLKSNNICVPDGGPGGPVQDDNRKTEDGAGLKNDASEGERSTLKRNRRNIKSCNYVGYANVGAAREDIKGSGGDVKNKPKPPRPPPPTKPTSHVAAPRPKAKAELKESKDQSAKGNNLLNRGDNSGTSKPNQLKKEETLDRSEWEIVDLPEERNNIDVDVNQGSSGQNKEDPSEATGNQKSKDNVHYVNLEHDNQVGENEKDELESESGSVAQDSKPEVDAVSQLKIRKALPPTPSKRNSLESGSALLNKSAISLPGTEGISQETSSGRPLSQGSPINGRSPSGSPKKTLRDRGRNSSPKRPSCPPPPPPPGTGSPLAAAAAPPSSVPSTPPKSESPVPPEQTSTTPNSKPKRPAPPRPHLPPDRAFVLVQSSAPKTPPEEASEDQTTNIYTEANSHVSKDEDEEESDGERDHEYELIPDPRRRTLPREKPPSSSDEEAAQKTANRASGYIDDGTYLTPNKPEENEDENDYVYPEFRPSCNNASNVANSPPPLPPNPETDQVFASPDPGSPVPSKSRRSSVNPPRRKAPKKPRRSHSMQSDGCYDSNSGDNARTADDTGNERIPRSPSDRNDSLSDSDDDDDGSLSEDYDDDILPEADIPDSEDGSDEQQERRRLPSRGGKAHKAFMVAKEIKDSERVFVDVLKLLNVDLRNMIDEKSKTSGKQIIDKNSLDQIIGHLPHLMIFNECLLTDLECRIKNWTTTPKIADIFLTKGHFLKLYSSYILDFERITMAFDDACSKNPAFLQAVREFEMSERCRSLAIKHYMLKPVQRIPQYKMLLTDYKKQLIPDTEEFGKTEDALRIVSEVANHANESMRQGDNFEKLLAIQHSLIGSQEIVKPGRRFIKEGELQKLSRRVNQPRKFYLLSDLLLHTTPLPTGQYKLNNELSLAGMKVSKSGEDECNELSIISVQRSFTLLASTKEDCESWYDALSKAINDYESKKSSFEVGRPESLSEDTSSLGRKAPLWIPDSRVTMCMICTSEFTITWRRHHCRACGKVTCGNCSKNKAHLAYLADKEARVCDTCFETLVTSQQKDVPEGRRESKDEGMSKSKSKKTKRRKSNRLPVRPSALKVSAKGNSSMSGYLWMRQKKKDWKRLWYRIKDKVLYTYKASEDVVALQSMPLLGYAVAVINETYEGFEAGLVLQLTQGRMKVILRADNQEACDRWNEAMVEASCLD